jgi:eukaryotic-like serine/threonine-protein kinase
VTKQARTGSKRFRLGFTQHDVSTMTADTAISGPRVPVELPGYRLQQLLGQGGMGTVHRAEQLSLGRQVAVKLLHRDLAENVEFVTRFEKEGAALAALNHPNIVSIVDRGTAKGTYYLVMELVDGASLRERLRDPLFDVAAALKVMVQVCRAVDYAHHRGIVHRDLKPENILFDEQAGDIPKVTDFGLAALDPKLGNIGKNLTQTHVSMGTVSYMAPEQRNDARTAGPRADIFALGVMLYEVLVGEVPLGAFEPPSVRKPTIDKRLDAIVARCLKPDPKERYESVADLLVDLEPLVAPISISVPLRLTKLQRAGRTFQRSALRVARIAAVAMVVLAFAVLALTAAERRRPVDARSAGQWLMTEDGAKVPMTARGRLDTNANVVTLSGGPDSVSVSAVGRTPTIDQGQLKFAAGEGKPMGRAAFDVSVRGEGLEVAVRVDMPAGQKDAWGALRESFRGSAPPPKAALMLLGEHGRFVALVVGASGEPPTLEWVLGDNRQGQLQAPVTTVAAGQLLGLRIDPETGALAAVLGAGRDARVLGEVLSLGLDWRESFGGSTPTPALGCLHGRCEFDGLELRGLSRPSWPTPPLPQPLSVPDTASQAPAKLAKDPARPKVSKAPISPSKKPPGPPVSTPPKKR